MQAFATCSIRAFTLSASGADGDSARYCSYGFHRVFRAVQLLVADAEREMKARLRRRQLRALAELVHGRFLVAHFVKRHAEIEVRDVVLRKQIARLAVIVDRLRPVAEAAVGVRQVESIRPHRRIQLHGLLEVRNRRGRIAVSREQLPEIVQRIAVIRIQADGLLVVLERRRVIAGRVGSGAAGLRIEKSGIRLRWRRGLAPRPRPAWLPARRSRRERARVASQ